MGEAQPFLEFLNRKDGLAIERSDLKSVSTGDVLRAVTASSIWLIEVEGHDDGGCVEGKLTFISENPTKLFGIQSMPALEPIVRVPAIIGGFLSTEHEGLIMEAQIPGRSPKTAIETAAITAITLFSAEQ